VNHAIDIVLTFIGVTSGNGRWYLFWSGWEPDLTQLAIVLALWHRFNCGANGCWRLGLRKVEGTSHVVCHKHHPHATRHHGRKATAAAILAEYTANQSPNQQREQS
jgi:hypothetical protein